MKNNRIRYLTLTLAAILSAGAYFYYFYARSSVSIPVRALQPALESDERLRALRVADGYRIDFFVPPETIIDSPRQIATGEDGWVFVGSRSGAVYAAKDQNGNGQADEVRVVADGLNIPHGVAFHKGKLYIGTVAKVYVVDDIIARLNRNDRHIPLKVLIEGLPDSSWHGTRHLKVGPDGRLYVSLGTPCNTCLPPDKEFTGVIRRYNLNGRSGEVYARGIRNSVGFDWHPETGDLWLTDNGSDWMGDDVPSDELNRAEQPGMHFGYPYCHQGNLPDPKFGKRGKCGEFVPPVLLTGAHVANLGIKFDRNGEYAYIALHGSWNRSEKTGYAVYRARISQNRAREYAPFVEGWLTPDKSVLGRPVDIAFTASGDMLITDDFTGAIYRVGKKP